MFLQYFASLLTLKHRPYISYALIGLFAGIAITGFYTLNQKFEEYDRLEVERATPAIADRLPSLIFENSAMVPDNWLRSVHFEMSRKAREKFDRIFLAYGTQIYQSGKIALVPWHVMIVPNVSQNPVHQVIRYEKRGTRVSRRITLIEVSKNDMPIKEFTLDLKLRKKHGKVLIVDLNISNAQDGTPFEQFLSEANVIENQEQFSKNRGAVLFYAPLPYSDAPKLSSDIECAEMALELNPRFCLGHLQGARFNIYDNNLENAEKQLSEAIKTASGPECARMIEGYTDAIKYARDKRLRASKLPPLTVQTDKANPKLKAVGFSYPDASAK